MYVSPYSAAGGHMRAQQTRGGLRPLPTPTGAGCAGSRNPLAVGRIRLHGLDALPNPWPWRATHLRSLARSGNRLPVAPSLCSCGPADFPGKPVARPRRDRGCTPPDDRSVLGHLAVRDRPQSPAPPDGMPGRGRPVTPTRGGAPGPVGCWLRRLGACAAARAASRVVVSPRRGTGRPRRKSCPDSRQEVRIPTVANCSTDGTLATKGCPAS